jgi:membrane protein YdbS with pleckstrin-like domain
MNCGKCGQQIEGDSKFCRHCGSVLADAAGAASDGSTPLSPLSPAGAASDKGVDAYRDPKHEQDVWTGRPSGRAYYGTWALWALGSAVVLAAAWNWASDESLVLVKIVLAIVLLIGLFILGRVGCLVFGNHYHLTTQRLFVRRGILSRTMDQTELVRVDDVRLRQGLLDRMLNTGDVEILGSDATDQILFLRSISAPNELTELVRLHVRGVRSKGTLFVEQV